jgi:hypothetical protein
MKFGTKSARIAGVILLVGALTSANTFAASASTFTPAPTTVGSAKTYYTTPHYKSVSGTAYVRLVSLVPTTDVCGGGGIKVGLRQGQYVYNDMTQFPVVWTGNVLFQNLTNAPPYQSSFISGTYYINAQYVGGLVSNCHATWQATFTW